MSQNLSVAREAKPLRHVAMVAKTLDEKKPKKSLRNEFASFQTSSILFNSTYLVGEIFLG